MAATTEPTFLLSSDLLKIYESSTAYDVLIIAGKEPNIEEFKAHSVILIARSPYFAAALSTNWAKKENDVMIFTKPNITPQIFEILLRYILD